MKIQYVSTDFNIDVRIVAYVLRYKQISIELNMFKILAVTVRLVTMNSNTSLYGCYLKDAILQENNKVLFYQ